MQARMYAANGIGPHAKGPARAGFVIRSPEPGSGRRCGRGDDIGELVSDLAGVALGDDEGRRHHQAVARRADHDALGVEGLVRGDEGALARRVLPTIDVNGGGEAELADVEHGRRSRHGRCPRNLELRAWQHDAAVAAAGRHAALFELRVRIVVDRAIPPGGWGANIGRQALACKCYRHPPPSSRADCPDLRESD